MNKILLILIVAGIGYFGYQRYLEKQVISDPIFAEARVSFDIQGRHVEGVFFGKTTNLRECHEWGEKARDKLVADCPLCTSSSIECKESLLPRYAKFFDDEPMTVTYLSANSSSSRERDMRLLFWGLNAEEGKVVCNLMQDKLKATYSGKLRCIPPIKM